MEYKNKKDSDIIIGFDTSHFGDYNPIMGSYIDGIYRDKEYVINECKRMCDDLIENKIVKDLISEVVKKVNE